MFREKKTIGMVALAFAFMTMIDPSVVVREKYLKPDHGHMLQGLLVVCREMRKDNNREQMTIVMQHDNFERVELYYVERIVQVETE